MLYVFIKHFLGLFIMPVLRGRAYRREKLRVDGKAIFVSNHISFFDPVMIAVISKRYIHFMAKKELFVKPLSRFFFKSVKAFPVNRHTADLASLKLAFELLKEGEVFGIFPEGKRSITGELDELEKGAAFLALRSNAPIIPIYISPDSYRRVRFRAIVGDPVNSEGLSRSRSEAVEELTVRISESLLSLKRELEGLT